MGAVNISDREKFVYTPSEDSIKASNIHRFMVRNNIQDYADLIKRSSENLEWFWDAVVKDLGISWYVPYEFEEEWTQPVNLTGIYFKITLVHNI